eukprot:jgi/Ulvmu1/2493/UM137_0019.1
MLLALGILAVIAFACFVTYRVLDLALAGAYQANFGGIVLPFIFANKAVSIVHAVCTTLFAVMILRTGVWNKQGTVELIDSRHRGTAVLVCWELAYLAHDTWSMWSQTRITGKKQDVCGMLHHIALLLLLPFYFRFEKGDFYIACMFLSSATNPLLHSRYLMKKAGMQGTLAFKACSVALVVLYLLLRILLWPAMLALHSWSIRATPAAAKRNLWQQSGKRPAGTLHADAAVQATWRQRWHPGPPGGPVTG